MSSWLFCAFPIVTSFNFDTSIMWTEFQLIGIYKPKFPVISPHTHNTPPSHPPIIWSHSLNFLDFHASFCNQILNQHKHTQQIKYPEEDVEWQNISLITVNRKELESRHHQGSNAHQPSKQHQVCGASESETAMCRPDFHWYGTSNAEKACCTSLCIAVHSGGIRGERDVMASRTTEGGLLRRARCGQDTNFAGELIRRNNFHRSTCVWHLSMFFSFAAIFQTWFLRDSRSHSQTVPLPKLLSMRHDDSWTHCTRCATAGQWNQLVSPKKEKYISKLLTALRRMLLCNQNLWLFSISFSDDKQKKFPIDNLAEWNHNNNPLGLRSMQVYVLVFDMGNLDTFQVSIKILYWHCSCWRN